MTVVVNTEQAAAWNGYEGRHWADHADRYDAINAGFNETLLAAAAITPTDHVLDIGCGNGTITRLAAARAHRGGAVGLDLSGPMLARAAAAADLPNVQFRQGDAQVYPLEPGRYNVAISRFAIMFFADPIAAFTNVRRGLAPDGRIALLSMRDFGDMAAVFDAMTAELPPLPQPGVDGSGPLSMSDPAVIESVLSAAGFTDLAVTPVDAWQQWGSDAADAARFFLDWGPMRHMLGQVESAAGDRARAAVHSTMTRFAGPTGVRLRGTGQLITGRVA